MLIYLFIFVDLACTTSTFWKKMEPIFALSGSDDTSYLNQQVEPVCHEERIFIRNFV